ncbi:hypothetical protein [Azospirillum sp. TSO22-1]|uniref:hypothetical protein n=1 Tax=Azospirillum sp. TSO22-1 TaxID=716789 RepID=UPI0011B50D48|nr:hypothetical protein [Azospirillum sp. TSO22-1]
MASYMIPLVALAATVLAVTQSKTWDHGRPTRAGYVAIIIAVLGFGASAYEARDTQVEKAADREMIEDQDKKIGGLQADLKDALAELVRKQEEITGLVVDISAVVTYEFPFDLSAIRRMPPPTFLGEGGVLKIAVTAKSRGAQDISNKWTEDLKDREQTLFLKSTYQKQNRISSPSTGGPSIVYNNVFSGFMGRKQAVPLKDWSDMNVEAILNINADLNDIQWLDQAVVAAYGKKNELKHEFAKFYMIGQDSYLDEKTLLAKGNEDYSVKPYPVIVYLDISLAGRVVVHMKGHLALVHAWDEDVRGAMVVAFQTCSQPKSRMC